jgi:ADP-ribosylglycohydrolase
MIEFASLNGHSRDIFEMVSFSVFCFMGRPEEFKSVVDAVSLGGKSSVRGAAIGAMIGAFAGAREIPPNLVRDVEGSNRVLAMARDLTDG